MALVMLTSLTISSQETPTVTVVLKTGTTITGNIKQFDPSSKIVLNVGGFDTTINMSDVSSVSNAAENTNIANDVNSQTVNESALIKGLPKDTVLNICGVDVKFILMSGGNFKYGYDGRGSMSMKSEPVHDVVISPFYVSEEFVTRKLYDAVYNESRAANASMHQAKQGNSGDELYLSQSHPNNAGKKESANKKNFEVVKFPENFSINYSGEDKSENDLNKLAFFRSDALGGVANDFPSVEAFLNYLNIYEGVKFNVPTEVQWFYYAGKKYKETSKLKTPRLIMCEFATQVSMSEKFNPKGYNMVVKGSTKHDDADEVELCRLNDRAMTKLTNITKKPFTSKSYRVSDKFAVGVGGETLCPIRLVMNIDR